MLIITPTAEDVPRLRKLMQATFTETFGHLYPAADLAAYLDSAYSFDALSEEVGATGNFWQMLVGEDGLPAAYLQCVPGHLPHAECLPEHGEIKRIYVLKSHQGKGIGHQLMQIAVTHFADRYAGAPQWVGVWSENLRAQQLYERYGFRKVGEYTFPVGNTEDRDFIFCRQP
jgi:ribosomal protein S18 acetylase RimI-like enzyme